MNEEPTKDTMIILEPDQKLEGVLCSLFFDVKKHVESGFECFLCVLVIFVPFCG